MTNQELARKIVNRITDDNCNLYSNAEDMVKSILDEYRGVTTCRHGKPDGECRYCDNNE